MAIRPASEFNIVGAPSEEWKRHHLYLAAQDNGAVVTGGVKSDRAGKKADGAADAGQTETMLQMARLADPAYQAMSARINTELDQMDERSVEMLQRIEETRRTLALRREEMLEQAYWDENGRPIMMNEDGTAAYYMDERGGRVDDEMFLQIRDELIGKPEAGAFGVLDEQIQKLDEHGNRIHAGMDTGGQLRDDVNSGAISREDAEQQMQDIRQSQGAALDAAEAAVSDAEEAILGVREDTPTPDAPAPDTNPAETNPATTPLAPGLR